MKLCWVVNGSHGNVAGRVYGYSTHRTQLRSAVEALGVEVTSDVGADYDIAIHVVGPNAFNPIPSKRNVLVTTVDSTEPTWWSHNVGRADALIVPCMYNRDVLSRWYRGPIDIVPEGIQPEFTYTERVPPQLGAPFRFLFHGAWDCGRKGLDLVLIAFEEWFRSGRMPAECQLIVKTYEAPLPGPLLRLGVTHAPDLEHPGIQVPLFGGLRSAVYFKGFLGKQPPAEVFPQGHLDLGSKGLPEVIIDQRDMSLPQIVDLYQSSHAFLLPSRSEGWGITLTQAFASGLPSVWTNWGAMLDYATADMGYQLPMSRMVQIYDSQIPGVTPLCAEPDVPDIIDAMERIYHNYAEACKRARIASERMRPYTWARAAQRFIEICEKYIPQPVVAQGAR